MDEARDIVVRRMRFEFPQDLERVFIKDDPEVSYLFLGTWMMLPYLEPYLIRSMQAALPKVTDPVLREELQKFCAQEGEHYRQHAKANNVIRSLRPGFEKLRQLEAEMAADFKRLSETKSLRFNLAYAEGFEALTSAMSRAQIEVGFFEQVDSPLADLALWHIMEELEHRNVAFEVYDHVCGGYLYRLVAGIWAQRHFQRWGRRLAQCMLEADPDILTRYATPEARANRDAMRRRLMRAARWKVLNIYMPWYSPRKFRLPERFGAIRARFSELALSSN